MRKLVKKRALGSLLLIALVTAMVTATASPIAAQCDGMFCKKCTLSAGLLICAFATDPNFAYRCCSTRTVCVPNGDCFTICRLWDICFHT